jgi:hypothetical protein
MRHTLQRKLLPATRAIALGLLAFVGVWAALLGRAPKQFDVEDGCFHFRICTITTGTTHTAISGSRLLGWVNRKLIGYRIHRISRDQMFTTATKQSETVLSIGYRHDGDALRLDTNGHSYPSTINLLDAVVVQPGGRTLPLKDFHGGGYLPATKEYWNTWILPGDLTNSLGYGLRLSRRADGKYVATCRLQ